VTVAAFLAGACLGCLVTLILLLLIAGIGWLEDSDAE
jgi:hypothetical protein